MLSVNCDSMSTQTLPNLNTTEGRYAYRRYWRDLVIDQGNMVLPSLLRLWQTAARATSFELAASGERFEIVHPLGVRAGTRIFMEEVVVRQYFNNIQALVYLGAVLLLISLGLRFAGLLSGKIALIGIGIEVLMLLMLFVVLFYTPEESREMEPKVEEAPGTTGGEEQTIRTIHEVLEELEEIGGSYAALGMRIEKLALGQSQQLGELADHVSKIRGLDALATHSDALGRMNDVLGSLVVSIERMNERIDILTGAEIEHHVRREIARRFGEDLETGNLTAEGPGTSSE